jgi:hypothetical protein
MKTFRVYLLLPFAVLPLAPRTATSQRFEIGVQAGYFKPAVDQFERTVPLPSSTGFSVARFEGRHDPGVAIGTNLSAWLLPSVGLDLAAAFRFGDRSGSAPSTTNLLLEVPAGHRVTLATVALRVVTRMRVGASTVRLGGGPAFVHLGGSAYDGGAPEISLSKKTFGGATLLADVARRVGRLRVRLGVEDAVYRVTMAPLAPGETTRTPLQHDLTLTAGVVLPLR